MSSLLEVGFSNALAALVLAPLAAWVGRKGRRPALAHGLWLLVLLKLVTPPLWSVPIPSVSGFQADASPSMPEVDFASAEDVTWELVMVSEGEEFEAAPVEVALPVAETKPWPWRPFLGAVWVLGTVGWGAVTWVRVRRFRLLLEEARPASFELQATADRLARRLGLSKAPAVSMLPGSLSPFVWSIGGPPRLLLPTILWQSLDDEQRATLLTHELAHLRRRDHWVRGLELLATALFWWHPVVYWARRGLREAEEQCCDAWVVWAWPKAAKAYATALLETVDFLAEAPSRPALPVAASGLGHVEQLKRRLTMILSGLTPHRLTFAGRVALVGLAAALLPLAPSLAQEPKEGEAKEAVIGRLGELATINSFVVVTDDDDHDDDKDDEDEKKDGDKKKAEAKEKAKGEIHIKVAKAREAAKAASDEARKQGEEMRKQGQELRRQSINLRTARVKEPASKEDIAALDKARSEMREAQASMAKAAKRLAELEMKVNGNPGVFGGTMRFEARPFAVEGKKIEGKGFQVEKDEPRVFIFKDGKEIEDKGLEVGKDVFIFKDGEKVEGKGNIEIHAEAKSSEDAKPAEVRVFSRTIRRGDSPDSKPAIAPVPPRPPAPPVPPAPPSPPARVTGGSRDQDRRIEAMERQIKQLLNEMKELKKGDKKEDR